METEQLRTPLRVEHGVITTVLYQRPFYCGGSCLYCISNKGFTKSTVISEDTLMAKNCGWDPRCQLNKRFDNYNLNEGSGYKLDVRVKGDSFTNHPFEYQVNYFKSLYNRLNENYSDSLEEALYNNQFAKYKAVNVKVETRPDLVTEEWCIKMLQLGITTVEIGVQHIDEVVLNINRRGHTKEAVIRATKLLKNYGFEVGYHIMLGLPGSSLELDFDMMSKVLWQDEYSPDCVKIYPCLLLTNFKAQKPLFSYKEYWKPLTNENYLSLLFDFLPYIPKYTHINKIQRLVNSDDVFLGPSKVIDRKLFDKISKCIWQRSIYRFPSFEKSEYINESKLITYKQSGGFCIVIESRDFILGYSRFEVVNNNAVIRDIRVLGDMVKVKDANKHERAFQHYGLGDKMLKEIEKTSKGLGLQNILINAAPGVVGYFEKKGYIKTNKYYTKRLEAYNLA